MLVMFSMQGVIGHGYSTILTVSGLYGVTPQVFIDTALTKATEARQRRENFAAILLNELGWVFRREVSL
jgi:hypothetical protein